MSTDTTSAPAGIPLHKKSGCMCSELGPEPATAKAPPAAESATSTAPVAAVRAPTFDEHLIERIVEFHGHMCPGLAMGMQAASIALREIGAHSASEEVVGVVENDTCGVDAIQFLTGCTFGKGNLIHRDWGRNAYTFHRRSDGRAVRLRVRPGAWARDPEHQALFAKVRAGEATPEERERFRASHVEQSYRVLALDADALYEVTEVHAEPPARNRSHTSVRCDRCGEDASESRVRTLGNQRLCRPCLEAASA